MIALALHILFTAILVFAILMTIVDFIRGRDHR